MKQQAALVESQVMGRAAIAVLVLFMQPVAMMQLFNLAQGSQTLDSLGIPHLPDVWAGIMVVAGLAMAGSYLVPAQDDTRVLEIAANALVALVSVVHLVAVLVGIGWSGSSWVSALDASLVVNCGGRAVLLARQIWWVKHRNPA